MGDILKDAAGHTSSKRIAGFIGLAMIVFVSLWHVITGMEVTQVIWPLVTFTGTMFGVTVLEKK